MLQLHIISQTYSFPNTYYSLDNRGYNLLYSLGALDKDKFNFDSVAQAHTHIQPPAGK